MTQQKAIFLRQQFGEARCQAALAACQAARNVRNRAGWIVQYLCRGWGTAPPAELTPHLPPGVTLARIQSEMRRCGPGPVLAELRRRLAAAQADGVDPDRIARMQATLACLETASEKASLPPPEGPRINGAGPGINGAGPGINGAGAG